MNITPFKSTNDGEKKYELQPFSFSRSQQSMTGCTENHKPHGKPQILVANRSLYFMTHGVPPSHVNLSISDDNE